MDKDLVSDRPVQVEALIVKDAMCSYTKHFTSTEFLLSRET